MGPKRADNEASGENVPGQSSQQCEMKWSRGWDKSKQKVDNELEKARDEKVGGR